VRIRFATAADVQAYYGDMPDQTMRAMVIEKDGAPVVIAGIALEGDRFQAFSEFKPEFEPQLKSMTTLRFVKRVQAMIAAAPLPVVAFSKGDPALLERLGFQKIREGAYLWPN
jgi:hypothetical protein